MELATNGGLEMVMGSEGKVDSMKRLSIDEVREST